MDSKVVSKEIKKHIKPLLKESGFEVFTTRCAWRYNKNTVSVIDISSFSSFDAAFLKCTTFSFAINVGVFYKCIPETVPEKYRVKKKMDKICPQIGACHIWGQISQTLGPTRGPYNTIWSIEREGTNLDMAISESKKAILVDALPWFDRFENYEETLRTLLQDDENMIRTWGFGRKASPERNYYIGYIALAVGDYKLAAESLEQVIDFPSYKSDQLTSDYQFARSKY